MEHSQIAINKKLLANMTHINYSEHRPTFTLHNHFVEDEIWKINTIEMFLYNTI